ncbi:ABC transporter ATP-binding protein [Ancylobacter sp. Lp-2]|uniref:ABC transporter ATP-binding protein n=1 Tax=Ancylobacter sp. Lp-2 TaxID=2881339 RepID=UPI001E56F550|nr:ABC transporter ATP-binding protein [Ancylobacter sp. Lp-2]MCB4771024.1 ABC transporter ATP-binding protein [Ancylobacter sp. Lp-2]
MLSIENLSVTFKDRASGEDIRACDGISLNVEAGELVGLVGESGCGKSTLGRTIVGLERASAGRVLINGVDVLTLRGSRRRQARLQAQYIFQDPYTALTPSQTIGQAIDEALQIAGEHNARARMLRARSLMEEVGLPLDILERQPRELSGGQRQRVCIARSLVVEPKVLICDEPVSSLDVSIRAQIMNLFLKLRDEKGLAILFIAHDLAVVRQAASRVYVMYLGQIMEAGPSASVYSQPLHPYTQSLLSAVPDPDPRIERQRRRILLEGDVPSPARPPSGCRFRTRCPAAASICASEPPVMSIGEASAHCHFAGTVRLMPAA